MSDDRSVVCIDMGSLNVRAGFAGDDTPHTTMRSVVGIPKYKPALYGFTTRTSFVGNDAVKSRGILTYHPVYRRGECTNFDFYEQFTSHLLYNELRVDPTESCFVLTDSVMVPHREKIAQVLFETFEIREMYCAWEPIMAFYGTGRSSCLSVCIGDGVTQIVPIVDGRPMMHSIKRINFGGRNVTKYLEKLLMQRRGYYFENSSTEQDLVRDIKETHGYVSQDYMGTLQKVSLYGSKPIEYTLPDGNTLALGRELFDCNEAWFDPSIVQKEYPGLHQFIHECVQSMAIDVRREMYENIYLSGAATLTEGLVERLQCEIQPLVPESVKCKIVAGAKREDNAWLGCSVLGSMTNYLFNMTMKREEYDEWGPMLVHSKFLE